MALVCDTVSVSDRFTIDISNERETVNVKDEKFELRATNLSENKLFASTKYKILPQYSYNSTEYIIPESELESIYVDINAVRADLLNELAGQYSAIIDEVYYETTSDDGWIKRQMIDLDAFYLSTGAATEYILKTELTNMVVAQEFLIDKWTGQYIQDRAPWDEVFVYNGETFNNNDEYLDARWGVQPEYDENNNVILFANQVAERDYPLSGLNGTLIYDGDEAKVYRYLTDLLAQDIYDLALRVDNNFASYTNEIEAFANNQTAYVTELTRLEASVDDNTIAIEEFSGVFLGYYLPWDGILDPPTIGMYKTIGEDTYVYVGANNGPLEDGWILASDSVYGYIGTSSSLVTNPDGYITGWQYLDSTDVPSEFKITADTFIVGSSTTPDYTPFRIEPEGIYFDGIVQFSNVEGITQQGINVCNGLYSDFNDTSLSTVNENWVNYIDTYVGIFIPSDQAFIREGRGCLRIMQRIPNIDVWNSRVILAKSITDYNINITAGKKWIISFYALISQTNSPITTSNLAVYFQSLDELGVVDYNGIVFDVTVDGSWARYSYVIDMTSYPDNQTTRGFLRFDPNINSGNGLTYLYIDQVMMEEQIGDNTEPSPYQRPGWTGVSVADAIMNNTTTIDGSTITAGTIRTENLEAEAITADKIEANAITAVKIDAEAVTLRNIPIEELVQGNSYVSPLFATGTTIFSTYIPLPSKSRIVIQGVIYATNATFGQNTITNFSSFLREQFGSNLISLHGFDSTEGILGGSQNSIIGTYFNSREIGEPDMTVQVSSLIDIPSGSADHRLKFTYTIYRR